MVTTVTRLGVLVVEIVGVMELKVPRVE